MFEVRLIAGQCPVWSTPFAVSFRWQRCIYSSFSSRHSRPGRLRCSLGTSVLPSRSRGDGADGEGLGETKSCLVERR